MTTTQLKIMGSLLLTAAATGCGRDTGYLYKDQPVRHEEAMGTGLPLFHYQSLTWAFECPSSTDPVKVPEASPTDLVFRNQGPYRLPKSRLDGTTVQVMGELCKPTSFPRDIAMVIDVSGSMGGAFGGGSDPEDRSGKSCGRLRAFHAVLNSIDWSSTQVAALTFDDDVFETSEMLFNSKDALISKLTNNNREPLSKILCASFGGTEYSPAFNEAARILRTGRPDASKEIFFLTDGEPTDGDESEERGKELREDGVIIGGKSYPIAFATLMLGDYSTGSDYLRDHYASKDTSGVPIHANVKEADKLAETLKNMVSKIDLVGGVLEYGDAAAGGLATIDVMPYLKDYKFQLPGFYLDPATLSDSYELNLVYWDSRNNRFKIRGLLQLDK